MPDTLPHVEYYQVVFYKVQVGLENFFFQFF